MMHTFQGILLLLFLTSCATQAPQGLPSLSYSAEVSNRELSSHLQSQKDEHSKSYLSLELPYAPFESLRLRLEKELQITLKNRGEAHITVISPPEFKKMQKKLSMKEIYSLAEKRGLLQTPYQLICIGKGTASERGETLSTYFAVVQAENLFSIRKAIQDLYIKRGGDKGDFNPEQFYPHVTLGFTHRDLHFEDGIIKGANSCIYTLHTEN